MFQKLKALIFLVFSSACFFCTWDFLEGGVFKNSILVGHTRKAFLHWKKTWKSIFYLDIFEKVEKQEFTNYKFCLFFGSHDLWNFTQNLAFLPKKVEIY
jgi:hypothetical protein